MDNDESNGNISMPSNNPQHSLLSLQDIQVS
jgi:hypothetical protein